MIYLVGIGQISIDRTAELLSKPCSCEAFNPTAVRILNDIHQGTYFASAGSPLYRLEAGAGAKARKPRKLGPGRAPR